MWRGVRRARRWGVAVALVAAPVRVAAAQSARAVDDSTIIRFTSMVVFEKLAPEIAEAAERGPKRWWKVRLPEWGPPEAWAKVRRHLLLTVNGRDSVATDTRYSFVDVQSPVVHADTLTVTLTIGRAFKCGTSWVEGTTTHEARLRINGAWWSVLPARQAPVVGDAGGCPAGQRAASDVSGNPVFPGWYADPEVHLFGGRYWIYPTYSAPYDHQVFMDAFSSTDLVTWEKHPRILDTANVKWARRAVWAPSVIEKDGWYYLFFGANDIQSNAERGGIGVARSRSPAGPFVDHIGRPLIDAFHNGAQPIDQMVFRDTDGAYYIVYGGWRHCNIARLNADFTGLVPFADGSLFKEITPSGYVEGAYMLLKDGKYYFMWSEGGWTGPDYAVAYAVGASPFGPFERIGKILQQDSTVATGAGHHSVLRVPGTDRWYIVYHRRPLGETDGNHRVVSIDELHFDERGLIRPVRITTTGVRPDPIR